MSRDLIIFSAEIISPELQTMFGKLPSAMVPFQGQLAIDYIYFENKNHYENIYIVTYKNSDLIEQHINNRQYDIKIIHLPEFGDLAYSGSFALEMLHADREVTLIFGDTYVPYMSSYIKESNALFFAYTKDSARWTVIDAVGNNKVSFIDKENLPLQEDYPVVIGVFHILHSKLFLQKIVEARANSEKKNKFYEALDLYYNAYGFNLILAEGWIDFGHSDMYFEQKFNVEARAFNEIDIDKEHKTLTKRSHHVTKLINEINWFLLLPDALSEYSPRIIEYSMDKAHPFVKMAYYNYLTLHEIFIFGNQSLDVWENILIRLKKLNDQFRLFTKVVPDSQNHLKEMYVNKTIERLMKLKDAGGFDFDMVFNINGKEYLSLNDCMEKLEEIVTKESLCENKTFNVIHGDFILSNILYNISNDDVRLIDPRGEFGEQGVYGDNLYEWAKLAHCLDGCYDFIISDRFDLFADGNNFLYRMHVSNNHENIKDFFYRNIVADEEVSNIKLIQSLLFFSMVPLHYDNKRRQTVMLIKAIELFYPFVKKYK